MTKERLLIGTVKRGHKPVFHNLSEKSWVNLDSHWIVPYDVLESWRERVGESNIITQQAAQRD